jgi:two-component system, cell cycle response regulator
MSDSEQNLQVLVVDDSAVYRKLVSDILYYQPYTVHVAKSGREALDLFAEQSPSIVITDWMMPDLSGLDLCSKIRHTTQGTYTYIILFTSMSEKDSVVKGLAGGADDYLTKPCDPDELQARIGVGRRIVELYRQIEAKNHQLEESTRTDLLTGLPNHLAVKEWGSWQLKAAARHGFPTWVVLADIDSFETINSAFGREAGDAVLQQFAQVLRDNSQSSDICGRVADDEFICMLTHVPEPHVAMTVERYRRCFEEHKFTFDGQTVMLTASFGAVLYKPAEIQDFATLVRKADKALYSAKQAGGNQIRMVG